MRNPVFIGLFLLMMILPVQAADEVYRLRTPGPVEYVERVGKIARQVNNQDLWQTGNFFSFVTDMVFRRFANLDQVDYRQLLATYDAMGIGQDGYFWRRGQWVEAILSAWLRQTQPDFARNSTLRFEDFVINVLPYDFDADGRNEYVLDVNKGQLTDRYECGYEAEYVNYLVVGLTDEGYQFIESPLYWEGYGIDFSFTNFGEGGQVEVGVEDLNADGLPEWLVLIGGETFGGPGLGYENVGRLYILGWREGRLVDLAALGNGEQYPYSVTHYGEDSYGCDTAVPRDVTWEFRNIDSDAAQEILQHQNYEDNWQCIAQWTKVIDWDAEQDQYVQIDEQRGFLEDSQNCERRQAEEAMWLGQYEQALTHYERALTLEPYTDPVENNPGVSDSSQAQARNRRITYDQYHLARMALAYRLTGQADRAQPILDALNEQEFSSQAIQSFVQALIDAPETPFAVCLAAYTSFAAQPVDYLMGLTQEQNFNATVRYSPSRIGCDLMGMLEDEINSRTFTSDTSPEDHVRNLGLSVRKVVQGDLNEDGQDEWLVWSETPINPLFFAGINDGQYAVSMPAVDPFDHADEIHLWALPDRLGTAVAYLTPQYEYYVSEPWACVYDCAAGGSGGECSPDGFFVLTMWRMEGSSLIPFLTEANVCRSDFDALFPDDAGSTQIDGGTLFWAQENRSEPIVYEWDSTRQTFDVASHGIEATPVSTLIATTEPRYYFVREALDARDYATALAMLDEAAVSNQDSYRQNPDLRYAYQYQRAFVLEALNRPEEALSEYLAIYQAAPQSAWGSLASLHFEIVE
ncbi:MAG: hypothetical protein SF123_09555 [Chloroflexota bacterium]|nr:hypothetical protein [Chloroflexota bacterium]